MIPEIPYDGSMTAHNVLASLAQETTALAAQLDNGLPTEKEEIKEVLRTLTAIHRASALVTKYAPALVKAGLLAGIPQAELVELPYHETQVRRLAREAGVEPLPKGRRPVQQVNATSA